MEKEPPKFTLEEILPKYTLADVIDEDPAVAYWEAEIDKLLDRLEVYVGRKLTKDERHEILEIVDKNTPRDNEGDIAGPFFPFDSAWEIYQARKQPKK